MIASILMIGGFFIVFIAHTYVQNLRNAERYTLERLYGIARTLSLQIDGDIHERLVCNFPDKDEIAENDKVQDYQHIHQLLKKAGAVNELESPIYTLFKSNFCSSTVREKDSFVLGVTSSEPYFRHPYESAPPKHFINFDYGGIISEYYDENGHWLSAFYPINNSDGKTVAIIQVDESFCGFVSATQKAILKDILSALLFLVFLSLIFIYAYRTILSSMKSVNTELNRMVEERTIDLKKSNEELNKLNATLESKVAQRTKELEVSNQELAHSNEKLKSFAYIVSHDLKAPLRSISSFGFLLQRRYNHLLKADGQEFLEFITTNAKKMSALISDILSNSLLEYQEKKQPEQVDLNIVIKDVLNNLQQDISEKQAQIKCTELPAIKGFSSDFVQLLQNFISNAIKYSRPDVAPVVEVSGERKTGIYHLTFKDNGRGISKEAREHIFDKFDRGNLNDHNGHGIGLSTCLRIVREYDGEISVKSVVGEGSSFVCKLKDKL